MSSHGDFNERNKAVAEVASKIFGETISSQQIIAEQLERSLKWNGSIPTAAELTTPISAGQGLDQLNSHPLAIWLENAAGIAETQYGLQRRKPVAEGELIDMLVAASSMSREKATAQILDLLKWIAAVNKRQTDQGQRHTCLPFKLHQFFAQTGSVYATLGLPDFRKITLEPGIYQELRTVTLEGE